MQSWLESILDFNYLAPELQFYSEKAIILIGILLVGFIANKLTRTYLLKLTTALSSKTSTTWDDALVQARFFSKVASFVPLVIIYGSSSLAFPNEPIAAAFMQRVAVAGMIVVAALSINAALNALCAGVSKFGFAKDKPIAAYAQVIKLIVFMLSAIFVISTLIDRSPWGIISGLGAMTAIIMLVFKDSILGFVASIQMVVNDMVRVGDWIEMPSYNADGNVIEVTINTVKVQNWDNTVSTIPTYALVTDGVKNWRAMSESGGRRIKRSILIDMNSIEFLSDRAIEKLRKISVLSEFIDRKQKEIDEHNKQLGIDTNIKTNGRRMTNVGVFRAYLEEFLRSHPLISKEKTLLIRQLQPTDKGLPIEIYVFSTDTRWVHYEAVQSDIFDHIFAVLPEFGLQVFQSPTGADFKRTMGW